MAEQKNQDLNQLLKVRRDKLAELQANGKDPFQITKFNQTHHSLEVKNIYEAHEAELLKDRKELDTAGLDEEQAKEALKKDYEELCLGEYKELLLQNRHYAYARVYNGQTCITVLSNDDAPKELWIPLPMGGTTAIDLLHHQTAEVVNGQLHLTIQGHDGAVIKIR